MTPTTATTASGIDFAMLPPQAGGPARTLLVFAMGSVGTLTTEPYARVGRLLHARGWNVASLDLPCHGDDRRPGEPAELSGWAARLDLSEDIVASFRARVSGVLTHLIEGKLSDGARIAAAGTSRGGFLAFHAAIADPRIRAVAAFSPVTDLLALSEFAGRQMNPLIARLALIHGAAALAGCASWIAIGSADERVGTDRCIAFTRALTSAQQRATAGSVALHVLPTPGHRSCASWHDDAARWLSGQPWQIGMAGAEVLEHH